MGAIPEGRQENDRLPFVDALRGAAALGVVAFHSVLVLRTGAKTIEGAVHPNVFSVIASILAWPVQYGYIGVMLFFVLSGFAIHLPYANNKRAFHAKPYFARRFFRIYPAYAAALIVSIAIASHSHVDRNTSLDSRVIVKSFMMLQNYPHWGGSSPNISWLQPAGNIALWSLPIELEMYLAYPLFLMIVRRFGSNAAMITVGLASVSATLANATLAAPRGSAINAANYAPLFLHYWIVWCMGAWLAERVACGAVPKWNRWWQTALVSASLAAVVNHNRAIPTYAMNYILMVLFSSAMVGVLGNKRLQQRIASLPGLCRVGDISYSLYLIHMPIFIAVLSVWLKFNNGSRATSYLPSMASAVAAVPIAYILYATIERPGIAVGRRVAGFLAARPNA